MERINQYEFYEIASKLSVINRFEGDVPASEAVFVLIDAESSVKNIVDGKPIPLGVSGTAARELHAQINEIMNEHLFKKNPETGRRDFKFPEVGETIPSWQWGLLKTRLKTFETVFSAEMRETTTYFVPSKGIYSTAKLIDRADDSFPEQICSAIGEKVRNDFRAAGRCLGLNLLTASGFHVVRAVEGILEDYYKFFCKGDKVLNSWHDYITKLEKILESDPPRPDVKTIAELKQMKDDYRNPVVHPRVVLSESDARMLFDNGESLIIAMAQEIIDAKNNQ